MSWTDNVKKYNCKICSRELDVNLTQISVCLDNKFESFCMGCESQIKDYVKKSGKKITPILSDYEWQEILDYCEPKEG